MYIPIITILLNILAALYWTVDSVFLEYCNAPVNTSDCGKPPISIYSYVRSGRLGPKCKVVVWRGCSTDNMFFNKKQCTKLCAKEVKVDVKNYRCNLRMNTDACNEKYELVYTFDNEKQACMEAVWRGCPTLNKYNDKRSCEVTCLNTVLDKDDQMIKTFQTFLAEEMNEAFDEANDTYNNIL